MEMKEKLTEKEKMEKELKIIKESGKFKAWKTDTFYYHFQLRESLLGYEIIAKITDDDGTLINEGNRFESDDLEYINEVYAEKLKGYEYEYHKV